MVDIISAGTANIKAYLYGAVVAVFLGMAGTIWYLNNKVDDLNGQLATTKQQLTTSKDLIAKMTGAEKIDESVNTFIDTGLSITLSEHDSITTQLQKDYEAYLMETRKEELCKDYCQESNEGKVCPIQPNAPKKPNGASAEDNIKKKMLEAAWKNYCLTNRLAEGCK